MNRADRPRISRDSGSSYASRLLGRAGDGSTLTLDFTTGILDPRLTFERLGGGTYTGNDGLVYGVDFATSGSLAIGTGSKSVTLTATANVDRRYLVGQTVWISNGANNMRGPVTAYNASTQVLTINATATTGSGSFTSWTVGNASARFDFDPTAIGTPRGLLIEASANNLVTNSSAMWNWGTGGVARVQDTSIADITGQTGTSNITTKVDKASGAGPQFHTLQAAIPLITVPANTIVDVTFSVWIRMNSAGQPKCSIGILDTSGTPSFGATFGTQSPGGQSVSNSSVTMSSYSSAECDYTFGSVTGWVRCSVSRRLNNTTASPINWTTGLLLIYPDRFTTNAATIYLCGGQVELGIGPSSWIPTGASTGSRSADSCVMTGTNFSSWFAGATAGTFYSEFDNPRATIGAAQTPASIGLGDYSAGNLLSAYFGGYTVGQALVAAIWGSGGTGFQTATVPTSVSVATGNKAAFAFSGQSVMGGFRGNASASATTTGTVNAKTVLYIGGNGASGTTNRDFLNSCVQRIKFFPTQFTAAQLQALTT